MNIWIATSNRGKLHEFCRLLAPLNGNIYSCSDIPAYKPPPETGETFEANARIKAKSLRSVKKDDWILADDSGLEVFGLNNLPGVHSARYAGLNASDTENTAKLLKMLALRSPQKREAQFRCVLAAYSPTGQEFIFEGSSKGLIAQKQRGKNGFGYDSVFIPEGSEKTFAEMTEDKKNHSSHRSTAITKFLETFNGLHP